MDRPWQLQELNLPTAVWIGKEDEVLDAYKVISFFKGLGFLLHKGLLEIDTVEFFLAGQPRRFWERLSVIIEADKKHLSNPEEFRWVEYLFKELQKREQKLQ